MKSRAFQQLRTEPEFDPIGTAHPVQSARHQVRSDRAGSASAGPVGTTTVQSRIAGARARYVTGPLERLSRLLFASAVVAALYTGWSNRHEGHLTPESGTGYMLGIAGAVMMLLLLLYPLRKRVKVLRYIGSVPAWFRIHMMLGVIGPSLILFHSNFSTGSLNSNVALSTMLAVVASGIVGRYLYAKVHNGLFGRKSEVRDILDDAQAIKAALGDDLEGSARLFEALRAFEAATLAPRRSAWSSFVAFAMLGVQARRCHRHVSSGLDAALQRQGRRHGWRRRQLRERRNATRRELKAYFSAVRKAARFSVYERLLAQWHIWHMPLFVLLVVTATVHVIAVHLY